MMGFSPPPARAREANLLPMINVVFLLLIFFLISAQLAPSEPFEVAPPSATPQDESAPDFTLYLGADGRLGFGDVVGADETVMAALNAARAEWCAGHDCEAVPPRLFLRADAAAPVPRVAGVLPLLGQAGFAQVDLVTQAVEAP